ncbi:hypothetical protein [Alicyclobacillus vulcanalis]|uniref:Uncharacterized protein n=1 Tax=Alicyclobacillus vulcanalis TaxID=252246 RepID=A0A1N7M352_9BACL|nr:hypothetical protein [Alicyclobacillus vulcanalis]SIS80473.1 hypothetical protein SAMN05421799_104187 [Alicyclobacillus vulcanalis]
MQPMQPMYGGQGQGQGMGYNAQVYQQMRQFATPAETVHQHMQQDAQYAQPSYGYAPMGTMGMGHSMLSQFGTNPQMVRQHIQQDLQSYGGPSAGPSYAGAHDMTYAQGYGAYGAPQAHAISMQGRQAYQQQAQGQGYGMSQMPYQGPNGMGGSHGYHAPYASGPYGQMMHMQTAQAPYGYGMQGQASRGAFPQYGTDPQVVRQHIQQDLGYYGAMQ